MHPPPIDPCTTIKYNMIEVCIAVLAPLIEEHHIPDRLLPTATDSAFHALAHVIMGQQLSVVAARNIAQKVKTACGVSRHTHLLVTESSRVILAHAPCARVLHEQGMHYCLWNTV